MNSPAEQRMLAIDNIVGDGALVYGANAVEGEEGGIVTVCVESAEVAERLADLLMGGSGVTEAEQVQGSVG